MPKHIWIYLIFSKVLETVVSSSWKICSWRTLLVFQGKFPLGNFSAWKSFCWKFSARKSFQNFRLTVEISVMEIYWNSGFRLIFSRNYNFHQKKFWRKIGNSTLQTVENIWIFIKGWLSLIICFFNSLRSVTHLILSSFFFAGTIGNAHGLTKGSITPCSNHSSIWSHKLSFRSRFNGLTCNLHGIAPGTR